MIEGVTDAQGPDRTKLIKTFGPAGSEDLGLHHFRYEGAPALSGVSDRHTIVLSRTSFVGIECSIGRQGLNHMAVEGNVALVPAGVEWTAKADGALDHIIVTVPTVSFAAAAARGDRPSQTITSQISGRDDLLQSIVDEMTMASTAMTEPGVGWHDLTNELLDHVADTYGLGVANNRRGFLAHGALRRINAYLSSRLEQKVAIDELADVAVQSASHFPRVFRRTVGLSPHQYLVRLRLRRARDLIRSGQPLAEAAVASGFVDQSHLTSWVRRIYGTTPARWATGRR